METIKIQTFIGEDGIVQLTVPDGFRNMKAEVAVSVEKRKRMSKEEWEAFIDASYGILADDPIERPDQGEFEVRDEIE